MSSTAFQPRLRLVGGDESPAANAPTAKAYSPAELAVIKENRLAAYAGPARAQAVDARDPRWILAMQTQARLQGTMLTPERRDEVVASGKRLGLRPFESNLIIAIVQDRARRQPVEIATSPAASLRNANATLEMLGDPASAESAPTRHRDWRWWMAAIGCAMMLAGIIIRWISAST